MPPVQAFGRKVASGARPREPPLASMGLDGSCAPVLMIDQPSIPPGSDAQTQPDRSPATPAERERLEACRMALLRMHRLLLDVERARYEKARGRIPNNTAFLQLVINDPWFDWLRPMAQLVLLIDERTSDKETPLSGPEARALHDRARSLLHPDPEGDAFQRLFAQAVQQAPALAALTRQIAQHLAR